MPEKTIKAQTCMLKGFHLQSSVGSFSLYADRPIAEGGTNTGPSPLQYLLVGLSGCVVSSAQIIARRKGIALRAVSASVEADFNSDALLGVEGAGYAGFSEVRVKVSLDADIGRDEKEALIAEVDRLCPASRSIAQTTAFSISLA